ncbi:hypothetical protein DLAC_03474 [Tieghemostelium lacteum]|uniref:Uncharacterized protein n=1 Tax=Tieghemostelium lacteum TaxID=361077 RepID=A0A152A2H5_TIELA|nr:hypothetical protein DLAC_03474 [Tieghemostelium lacteum]|eukprot:KYR00305.1 hypothetical protein DLAC_03474 [Tieghemostelium lacteum]
MNYLTKCIIKQSIKFTNSFSIKNQYFLNNNKNITLANRLFCSNSSSSINNSIKTTTTTTTQTENNYTLTKNSVNNNNDNAIISSGSTNPTGLVESLRPKKIESNIGVIQPKPNTGGVAAGFEIDPVQMTESDPILDPIIKVFSVLTSPNHFIPWQMKPQREVTGSGFAISGRRILTNAHVVADQTSIMLAKFGNANKYAARVIASAHEYDLALLTVDDEEFWRDLPALEFGDIPDLQDLITVIGFPTGGSNICVTQGVVSRIDLQPYAHSETKLLSIQIDAAINPGNSGGPALKDGKVVGIAFQNLVGASSVGFIIPVPVINRFLRDIEMNGRFTGVPMLGILSQNLDSIPKSYFKLPSNQTGIIVNEIHPLSSAKGTIKVQDIITHINGVNIANDGSIAFRRRERISFEYLLSNHYVGDKIQISLIRQGENQTHHVQLVNQHRVVPFQLYDSRPSYFVYSGLVFVPLTYPLLTEISEDFAVTYRKVYEKIEKITSEDHQVVIMSQVLYDKINYGYAPFSLSEVKKVNGTPIRNLKHLVELIENNSEPYITITLENNVLVILDSKDANDANIRIMKQHSIPNLKSEDLVTK